MTTICGNISKEATTRVVKVGNTDTFVTDFNVAVNRGYGENRKTKFYRITLWRDRGTKLAPYLTKGRLVYLEGELDVSAYIDKDGKAVGQLEMVNPYTIDIKGKKPANEDADVFDGNEVEG
ncbi:MAG: single-stranded DNA-binding protein [Paludibacteraceae bacterium]|nr:single-stranded DNA-binding protein [Paludibacteraceae bacterium]